MFQQSINKRAVYNTCILKYSNPEQAVISVWTLTYPRVQLCLLSGCLFTKAFFWCLLVHMGWYVNSIVQLHCLLQFVFKSSRESWVLMGLETTELLYVGLFGGVTKLSQGSYYSLWSLAGQVLNWGRKSAQRRSTRKPHKIVAVEKQTNTVLCADRKLSKFPPHVIRLLDRYSLFLAPNRQCLLLCCVLDC